MPPKKKILIIEDEKALTRVMNLKLSQEGFDLTSLPNGENLIPTLNEQHYSLILCDLMMPIVDGFQVLKLLKQHKITTPVIILTSLGQGDDEKRVREFPNVVEYLIKATVSLTEIVVLIKQKSE